MPPGGHEQMVAMPARLQSGCGSEKTLVVGIGAQKSGTTWLADYFNHHAEVFMAPIKELHHFDARLRPDLCGHFDRQMIKTFQNLSARLSSSGVRPPPEQTAVLDCLSARIRMVENEDAYLDYFLSHARDRKIMCEITPSYSLLDRSGFAKIAALHPQVKFIFLMRNPVDRFWSHMRYNGLSGSKVDPAGALASALEDPQFVLRTDYRRTLSEFFAGVGEDNLLMEFYENLFTDGAVRRLCEFLGIAFKPGKYGAQFHVSPRAELSPECRRRVYAAFAHVFAYVDSLFAGAIPESWKRDMAAHRHGAPIRD